MTATTILGDVSDGRIQSQNVVYATARSGGTLTAQASNATVGQTTGYFIFEYFVYFDTSVLDDSEVIDTAELALVAASNDFSTTDFVLQARTKAWSSGGLTTADWVAGASLSALPLLATLSTVDLVADATTYSPFVSESGFAAAINRTGLTEILICSDRQIAGATPTGDEYVNFLAVDDGAGTAPRLIVSTASINPLRTVSSPMRW